MFDCVWCKKKIESAHVWTKEKEPLCGGCSEKYSFGLHKKLIEVRVSQLSKEQRRNISSQWHDMKCFRRAMLCVKKVTLSGGGKIVSNTLGVIILGMLMLWASYLNRIPYGTTLFTQILTILASIIVSYGGMFLLFTLYMKINWLLKLRQLKKEHHWSDSIFS